MKPLRIGIIGCGAVVERFHLPASTFTPEISIEALVDRDQRRAQRLADIYGVRNVFADYRGIVGKVDAAIVALPHSLNGRISQELLTSGIPEKPLGVTAEEAKTVVSVRLWYERANHRRPAVRW